VTIDSDSSNSPLVVAWSGTGLTLTSHGAILFWTPSASVVAGYRVYRSAVSEGPYQLINSQSTTNFVDLAVSAGQAYFYVVTAVDANNVESDFSNEIEAVIPAP
jgi:fibronectin type 3 domain-containing protein